MSTKKWRDSHKKEIRAWQHQYDLTHKEERKLYNQKNREQKLLTSYKYLDKKKGFECDLTVDYIKENITSKPCIYCGDTENIGGDREDNTKGHTKENSVPCCVGCNETKMDNYSFEEMLELGKTIRQIKEQRKIKAKHNIL